MKLRGLQIEGRHLTALARLLGEEVLDVRVETISERETLDDLVSTGFARESTAGGLPSWEIAEAGFRALARHVAMIPRPFLSPQGLTLVNLAAVWASERRAKAERKRGAPNLAADAAAHSEPRRGR